MSTLTRVSAGATDGVEWRTYRVVYPHASRLFKVDVDDAGRIAHMATRDE